jgi:hypothetical protein
LNFASDQRANHAGRAAADDDHFGIDAVLLKKAFFFCDPDAARCGTDRTQAYPELVLAIGRDRQK